MPQVGDLAPDFAGTTDTGETIQLSQLRGRFVVLYFYPKDDTPGCTKEACGFRDAMEELTAAGAVVLGVSPDDPESHRRFREKYDLNFHLISDPDHHISTLYEAYGEKKFYGRTRMGVLRKTYLIDPEGRIVHIWPRVRPEGHAAEVLARLRAASEQKNS